MDLIKIGRYIAGKRKGLGLTQRQLADKLGMSDKSVSKWERGICLPDVSVYAELCCLLGISISEFLSGEDIARTDIVQKADETLIEVTTDGKKRRKRLFRIIGILLAVSLIAVCAVAAMLLCSARPRNFITPLDKDSIEMKTAEMLAGSDSAFIYKYTTTDAYDSLVLYISEYRSGMLVKKEKLEIGYEEIGSPERGTILIVPEYKDYQVKLILADDGSKLSTEIPILTDVPEREHYGRSATQINETDIRYDEEQLLLALIYDNDGMHVTDIYNLMCDQSDALAADDYVYCFSFEFCKQ